MMRASRFRALGAAVSILVALVIVPAVRMTPALAYTTCGKHLGVKTTLLTTAGTWPVTVAEVYGEAGLRTQGTSTCWGRGVYDFLYHTTASSCYLGAAWLDNTGCYYDPLTGDYWWTVSGTKRYYNMKQHTYGKYKVVDPTDPELGRTFTLHAKFTIRFEGTYTRDCYFTGTLPSATKLDCHDTGIQSGR